MLNVSLNLLIFAVITKHINIIKWLDFDRCNRCIYIKRVTVLFIKCVVTTSCLTSRVTWMEKLLTFTALQSGETCAANILTNVLFQATTPQQVSNTGGSNLGPIRTRFAPNGTSKNVLKTVPIDLFHLLPNLARSK